ncbi:MAG: N-terminal phage integrase SAM-like domain-containing protein [Oscillospiraceae bacterium]
MLNRNEVITHRKDGRYMGRFIIDHREDGKPIYQYVYGSTYEEAEEKLRIAHEIEIRYLSGKSLTLHTVYKEWLNGVANRVKESTYANYRMKFEQHILSVFGDISCTEITSGKLNAFIKEKMDSGLSASYVRDIMTVFKSLLRYVQEEYHIHISLKNVVMPKVEKKSAHKMSDEQQSKLVAYIKNHLNLTTLGILLSLREFDEKIVEKTAKICYNENNHELRKQKGGFFYGRETNSNFLRCR